MGIKMTVAELIEKLKENILFQLLENILNTL